MPHRPRDNSQCGRAAPSPSRRSYTLSVRPRRWWRTCDIRFPTVHCPARPRSSGHATCTHAASHALVVNGLRASRQRVPESQVRACNLPRGNAQKFSHLNDSERKKLAQNGRLGTQRLPNGELVCEADLGCQIRLVHLSGTPLLRSGPCTIHAGTGKGWGFKPAKALVRGLPLPLSVSFQGRLGNYQLQHSQGLG